MIVVKILGGFASQLGKYAYAYEMAKKRNDELILDISEYVKGYFRPFMLANTNIIDCKVVSDVTSYNLTIAENGNQLISLYEGGQDIYLVKEEVDYRDFFDKYPEFRISEKFDVFSYLDIKNDTKILDDFKEDIKDVYSVAVHIRRGDFVNLGLQNDTIKYKKEIINTLNEHSDAVFYFFSNDIEWVKKEYGQAECFKFIEERHEKVSDLEDFFCMSMCKKKILSSMSGYSKYAHFLGKRKYGYCEMTEVSKSSELNNEEISMINSNFNSLKNNSELNYHFEKDNSMTKKKDTYDCFIVSEENFDSWSFSGLLSVAVKLAEKKNVLYININTLTDKKLMNTEVLPFCNMDGKYIGFDALLHKGKVINIKDIMEKYNLSACQDSIIISDVPVICRNYIYINRPAVGKRAKLLKIIRNLCSLRSKKTIINITPERNISRLNITHLSDILSCDDLLKLIDKETNEVLSRL